MEKVVSKKIFVENNIYYPKGKLHEDSSTTYKLLYLSNNVSIIKAELHYYRIRNDKADIGAIEYFNVRMEEEFVMLSINYFCRVVMEKYIEAKKMKILEDKIYCRKYLLRRFREIWKQYGKSTKLSLQKKHFIRCFVIFLV